MLGVDDWLVGAYQQQSLRTLAQVVRTVHGNSDNFEVEVGMHKGSALCSLLSVIVIQCTNFCQKLVHYKRTGVVVHVQSEEVFCLSV